MSRMTRTDDLIANAAEHAYAQTILIKQTKPFSHFPPKIGLCLYKSEGCFYIPRTDYATAPVKHSLTFSRLSVDERVRQAPRAITMEFHHRQAMMALTFLVRVPKRWGDMDRQDRRIIIIAQLNLYRNDAGARKSFVPGWREQLPPIRVLVMRTTFGTWR